MSPAVLLLIVDISFPCSNLFYSLHFEAEPCCTIYSMISKCINRSYPRHSNLDANILPPQCKGPFGDWEGEISQQSPAKHHHFWFVLTIDSVCWFFRVFRSFLRTSKGTSKVNTAQTPRHANQTLDLPSAKKGENNIRGWKGMVWPCKSTRKQDETSASRFLRGKKKVRPHRSLWFIPFSRKFKSSYWVRKKGKRTPPDNSLKRNAAKRHKTQLSAIVQSQANIALRSNGKRWCLRF